MEEWKREKLEFLRKHVRDSQLEEGSVVSWDKKSSCDPCFQNEPKVEQKFDHFSACKLVHSLPERAHFFELPGSFECM